MEMYPDALQVRYYKNVLYNKYNRIKNEEKPRVDS